MSRTIIIVIGINIILALILCFQLCSTHKHNSTDTCKHLYYTTQVDFSTYNNKIVRNIEVDKYITGQHDFIIHFADGDSLVIVANKYVLNIYK